jgi:NAD(P)H-hydrate epimerase
MLESATDAVQSDRFAALKALNAKYGGVCVLKGAGSLLGSEKVLTAICRAGNPGMASGGMGDLLSGIIAALLAQQLSLSDAAEVGVLLHASAADVAASEDGERGMSASDVLKYARQLANPERRN